MIRTTTPPRVVNALLNKLINTHVIDNSKLFSNFNNTQIPTLPTRLHSFPLGRENILRQKIFLSHSRLGFFFILCLTYRFSAFDPINK